MRSILSIIYIARQSFLKGKFQLRTIFLSFFYRSVTPSSASHPDTPPAQENHLLPASGRNYSDFMRSLAAKYNNNNPNEYVALNLKLFNLFKSISYIFSYFNAVRNGFPPPTDPRFKATTFPNILPTVNTQNNKESEPKKPEFPVLHPFASAAMFPPLIDMSTTQTLLAMVRTAKEAELQVRLRPNLEFFRIISI